MKTTTLLVTIALMLCGATTQSTYAKVSKEQKELLKQLKKSNNYKDADYKDADDGYKYILIETEKKRYIIADSTGHVIFGAPSPSVAGYDKITYYGAHSPGMAMHHYYKKDGLLSVVKDDHKAYYLGNAPVFMAQTESDGGRCDFYATDGTLLNRVDGKCEVARALPVLYVTGDNGCGLANLDGSIIVEPEHKRVEMSPDGVCFPVDDLDGVEYYGGVDVTLADSQRVPCLFAWVSRDGDQWYVRRHSCYPTEQYDDTADYTITFLDDGEKYFEAGNYTKCRDYYELRAPEAAWAPFYIGMSDYMLAVQAEKDIQSNKKKLSTAQPDKGGDLVKWLHGSVDNYEAMLRGAISTLDNYAKANEDSPLAATAKRKADEGFDALSAVPGLRTQVKTEMDNYHKRTKEHRDRIAAKEKADKEKADKKKADADKTKGTSSGGSATTRGKGK